MPCGGSLRSPRRSPRSPCGSRSRTPPPPSSPSRPVGSIPRAPSRPRCTRASPVPTRVPRAESRYGSAGAPRLGEQGAGGQPGGAAPQVRGELPAAQVPVAGDDPGGGGLGEQHGEPELAARAAAVGAPAPRAAGAVRPPGAVGRGVQVGAGAPAPDRAGRGQLGGVLGDRKSVV